MSNPTPVELPGERLDEILAGLDGVTPGPWRSEPSDVPGHNAEYTVRAPDGDDFWEIAETFDSPGPNDESAEANARHIARCDPDTIRSIVTELKARRTARPAVEARTEEAMTDLVERLRHPRMSGNDLSYGTGPFFTDEDVRLLVKDAAEAADALESVQGELTEARRIAEASGVTQRGLWQDITELRASLESLRGAKDTIFRNGEEWERRAVTAEAALAASREREAELVKALEPFAVIGECMDDAGGWSDNEPLTLEADQQFGPFAHLRSGDFRRARALAQSNEARALSQPEGDER